MAENKPSDEPKSFLADENQLKAMIEEDTYLANGYLTASNDFCGEISKKLEQANSFEDLKAELLAIVAERQDLSKRSQKWFP